MMAQSQPSASVPLYKRRRSAGFLFSALAVSCLLPLVTQARADSPIESLPSILPLFPTDLTPVQPPVLSPVLPVSPATSQWVPRRPKGMGIHPRAVMISSPKPTTSSKPPSTSSKPPSTSSKPPSTSSKPPSSSIKPSSTIPSASALPGQANDKPSQIKEPTFQDIFRYRHHYGANLGAVWVLERWLYPSMFPADVSANLTAELAAVQGWVKDVGMDAARKKFEEHWANAMTPTEFEWIVTSGHATTMRVPIGFFTLGPKYTVGTPFESVGALYQNAWSMVKQAVAAARGRGIGVLLDFHALPGGANAGDHSGTNSGYAQLWGNPDFLALAKSALEFLVREASTMENVIGVQVVNEASYNAPGMYTFYTGLLDSFSTIDKTMPIYISDGWDLKTAISFVKTKNTITSTTSPLVIDTHLYWAFDAADWASSPQQIIAKVPNALSALDGQDGNVVNGGAVSVVVGEWSVVLDDRTWARKGSDTEDALTTQFAKAQVKLYQARSSGAFFWSAKMDTTIHGGSWCFSSQTKKGNIAAPAYMLQDFASVTANVNKALAGMNATLKASASAHSGYWDQAHPTGQFEHWRFEAGWKQGFNDSMAFYQMRKSGKLGNTSPGADRIGLLDLWVRKRIIESGMQGNFLWEYEQGFRKGVADFGSLTGAY